MSRSRLIWLIVTVLGALYICAGAVETSTEKVGIKLEPGYSARVRIFRLAENRLQMRLVFEGHHRPRPELGYPDTRGEWSETGQLKFDNPGAAIRIVAVAPGAKPVTYEAMPKGNIGSDHVFRGLTASLSIAPGVWRWPPAWNELVLHPGMNVVSIEVVAVEPPLIGEAVELWVDPALSMKRVMPNVAWLWFWFLWPLFVVIQLVWAAFIGLLKWKIRF